jgi:hypothetical protein
MVEPTPLCHHQTTEKCGSRKYEMTNPWRSLNKQKRDLRFWEKSKKIKNEFWNGVKMLKVRSYTYSKKNQTNNINYTLNFSYDKWMNIWFNKCLILNIDTLMHFLPLRIENVQFIVLSKKIVREVSLAFLDCFLSMTMSEAINWISLIAFLVKSK